MDSSQVVTGTAQASAAAVPAWSYISHLVVGLISFFGGLFTAAKKPGAVTTLLAGVDKAAPLAEEVATLAGQPATAQGIVAAQKLTENALATIQQIHAQALASTNPAPGTVAPVAVTASAVAPASAPTPTAPAAPASTPASAAPAPSSTPA